MVTVDCGGSTFLRDARFGRVVVDADDAVFFARGVDLRRVAGSVTSDEFSSPDVVVVFGAAPFSAPCSAPFSPAGCAPSDGAGPDASGVRSSVSGEAAARSMETTEGEDMRGFLDARIPPKPATRIACTQGDLAHALYPRRI
jgi:hypothetical protein